ncbi:glycoside-pentoside-hexuronide (GPH):cation symporter [Streptococcus tangpeifui]|uniref:glycoside-pentoside-hexuronide (GPH):cation symporter n=1 Tax=Streptococcus tangpeifui TaxID=2709400 RepID=UPI0013ED28F6|nr:MULTISPECIES: glycoside-pentoside-hexuronide (GPH):cation symporter [unclassified Streptococcus]
MEEQKKLSNLTMIMYGMGDLASQFVWTFVGTYLTVYYTDIVGLAPAAVSAIMFIARIFDAFNDPVMGVIAERTESKWGRFRPYIIFGSPFLVVFSVLTFTGPFGNGTSGVAWAAFTYIIAGLLYTLVTIPYGAMAAVMTTDDQERNTLNAYRSIGMNAGMIIVNSLSVPIMLFFSKGSKTATSSGYLMTALIYAIVSLPIFYGVFKTAREVVKPIRSEKVPLSVTLKNIVGNKYLMIVFGIMILQMTAYMGRIAITSYYVIYCLGSFALISLLMTIPSIGGVICSLFIVPLIKKFGKRTVLAGSMMIQGIGLIIVYFSDFSNIILIIIGHIIFGIFNMGYPITLTMVADSVDYQELQTGVRTDGTAYATYGLATKVGNAVGGAVGVLALSYMGYRPNVQQTPSTQAGINLIVNLVPAILFIIGAAIAYFMWDLSAERMDEIHLQLMDKREIRANVDEVSEEIVVSDERIYAPVSGKFISLENVDDNVFASGALGQGFAIKPDSSILVSPANGIVTSVYSTGHVYTLRTTNGAELLIHLGLGTVALDGKGFAKTVKVGDKVQVGQQLGAFDRDVIEGAGLDDIVLVLVTNTLDYSSITSLVQDGQVSVEDALLQVKK